MFRPKLAVWLMIALVAAWLASCSSNVDGYHLATDESGVSAAPGEAGAAGGAAGNGGQPIGPSGGIGPRGGTGGLDSDARAGDSSLGGAGGAPAGGAPAGGAPAGGAGGGDTGGSNTGGIVAGGAPNGGTGGMVTGGAPNGGTGGMVTGGTQNGGAGGTGGTITGGGSNTGGAPTGGRGNTGGAPTGGAPTGGAPTGGAPTGGAPTGGAPTGGAPTGGAPTGGAPTGGVAGTGGAGGYPGNPTQVTLTGASATGITAASWEPMSRQFFLLKPSSREYFVMSTTGAVTGPNPLQGTGNVAQNVFGASDTDVFFVSGTSLTLFRQPISGSAALQKALPGSPTLALLSGAYANGWFFIGNASGACQALSDVSTNLDPGAAGLSNVYVVTTDTTGFAFRTLGGGNVAALSRTSPGTFAANSNPCSAGVFSQYQSSPIGVHGNTVAWVISRPLTNPYELNVATLVSGVCGTPLKLDFGNSSIGSQAVGLIDATDALVTPQISGTIATVAIIRAGDQSFSRSTMTANMGTAGFPVMFVVGVEATTHYAVLVTKNTPALISF